MTTHCPSQSESYVKSGIVKGRKRYRYKDCPYFLYVVNTGKCINPFYVVKALQLQVEGISPLREIERIIGINLVFVMNWVRKYCINRPVSNEYHPTYCVLSHVELVDFLTHREKTRIPGPIETELGNNYMVIKQERSGKSI